MGYGYESDVYVAGPGQQSGGTVVYPPAPQKAPDPTAEVVPAGAGWVPSLNYAIPRSVDDITGRVGPRTYEMMLADPAVSSSYNTHKMGMLTGGVKLKSAVKIPAWSKRQAPPAVAPEPGTVEAQASAAKVLSPEQEEAQAVLDFCNYCQARVMDGLAVAFWELLDAMREGCKLAEIVCEAVEEGEYAGKLALKSLKVKPNSAWQFVVDSTFDVKGFLAWSPEGGQAFYPPDKFVWLSWMPRDSDPRGTSLFRAAHLPWNIKVQTIPDHYAHNKRFGSPSLSYEMAPGDVVPKAAVDVYGRPKGDGTTMEVAVFYSTMLGVFRNGGTFVGPSGGKLDVIEPRSNGEAFFMTHDWCDRQIMLAIEYQTRAALEAKNGSKADSETSQDRKGLVLAYGRDWLASAYRRVLKYLVALNYGREAAERSTPYPTFGNAEHQDRPALWTAAGSLGFQIGQSQLEEMDDELGLPIRDSEADAAAAQQAMERMAALKPQPGGGDTAGGSKETKTAPKGKPAA